jgi:membrane protease subunit HflK
MSEEANAYKARVIAEAKGDASRFTQILQAYQQAPDVTRERLYLETMESVMSNTNKIMVDVPNGNNLLYLPLDRLTQRNSAEQSNSAPPAPAADAAAPLAPEQKNNDLRDRDRTRGER